MAEPEPAKRTLRMSICEWGVSRFAAASCERALASRVLRSPLVRQCCARCTLRRCGLVPAAVCLAAAACANKLKRGGGGTLLAVSTRRLHPLPPYAAKDVAYIHFHVQPGYAPSSTLKMRYLASTMKNALTTIMIIVRYMAIIAIICQGR